ncbi:MAG: antibiotic biosynthesis monooxygenase [Hyphomonadaceae bacterium JAD_PAG50586_4]|nr:MAG: antibiotic biosynthesis monooxygenase [Hyphomonadaceae bacterium JAD_PAG50586_4]
MIGVIATMKVKADQTAPFEAAMRELVAATRANEPGVTTYHFCRSQKNRRPTSSWRCTQTKPRWIPTWPPNGSAALAQN